MQLLDYLATAYLDSASSNEADKEAIDAFVAFAKQHILDEFVATSDSGVYLRAAVGQELVLPWAVDIDEPVSIPAFSITGALSTSKDYISNSSQAKPISGSK